MYRLESDISVIWDVRANTNGLICKNDIVAYIVIIGTNKLF